MVLARGRFVDTAIVDLYDYDVKILELCLRRIL